MIRCPLAAGAAMGLCLIAWQDTARAEVYDYQLSADEQFRMWIDDDQEVVYGLLVVWNESAGDTRELIDSPYRPHQDFARSIGFGLIGTRLPDPGYADDLIDVLGQFATMSGHPEIAHAPVLCEGLSLGGYTAMEFAATYPERTIGFLSGAMGRLYEDTSNPAFVKVPGLVYKGELDPDLEAANDIRDAVIGLRATGAQMAYFTQWDNPPLCEDSAPICSGHNRGFADELGWKFFADLVRLRYPEGVDPTAGPVTLLDIPDDYGWLADYQTFEDDITFIAAHGQWTGAASGGFWLPTRDLAFAYRGHATRELPIVFTDPTSDPDNRPELVTVDPGDSVAFAVDASSLTGVARVEVFDGSSLIGEWTEPPYQGSWTAESVGAHALVAVATLDDDSQRTGYIAPILVRGSGLPGGGGLDTGDRPDAGSGGGGGSGDGDGGPTGPGAGNPDDSSGCGCQSGGPSALPTVLVLLLMIISRARTQLSSTSRWSKPGG